MQRRSAIRASLVAGLVGLLGIAGAVPALAAIHTGGAITRTKDILIATNDVGEGTLSCPSGYRVTAGGVRWLPDGLRTGVDLVALRSSAASLPIDGGRAWYANGYNHDPGTSSATMRIVITCLSLSVVGTLTSVKSTLTPAGDGHAKTAALCGTGKRVVSGGAAWVVPGQGLDDALAETHSLAGSAPRKDAKGWIGLGQGPSSASLRVVAMCRSNTGVGAYQTRTKEILPSGINIAVVVYLADGGVSCPSGTRVVTGGAYWRVTGGGPVADGFVVSSAPSGKTGWYAGGPVGTPAGADRKLVLVVHCRSL